MTICPYVSAYHSITEPPTQKIGEVQIPIISKAHNVNWQNVQAGSNLEISLDSLLTDLIRDKKSETVVSIMLDEVFSSSNGLARIFRKNINDRSQIPFLIQELKEEGELSESEYGRLTTLLMALDGLDVEVNEYGAQVTTEDLKYVGEYLEIVKRKLAAYNRDFGDSYQLPIKAYSLISVNEVTLNLQLHFDEVNLVYSNVCEGSATNGSNTYSDSRLRNI